MSEHDRAHFSIHPSNLPLYEEFEKKLVGKLGQKVVLFYTTQQGNYFRLGLLEGEELVWDPQALVTLPISKFSTGPEGVWKKDMRDFSAETSDHVANIFNQKVPALDHFPTLLGNYILGEKRVSPWIYPRPSSLEVFIGEDESNRYFKEHEDMDLFPSEYWKSLMRGDHLRRGFLGALTMSEEELAKSRDDL